MSTRLLCPLFAWTALVAFAAGFSFDIPPASFPLDVAGSRIDIPVSGSIVESPSSAAAPDARSFDLHLHAGLAGLQDHITPLLASELNQSERCGNRVSILNAMLMPAAPASQLSVQLHLEKWACFKVLGKETAKRLIGGDGNVQLKLTPAVEQDNTVKLNAEILSIDAGGSLGELLRSGSLGKTLRDKIAEAILKAVRKSTDTETMLPAAAQPWLRIVSVSFGDSGNGQLALNLDAQLLVPSEKVSALFDQLRAR